MSAQARIATAVLPVAGRGTRLLPATKSVPKELLPLGRKPVIQHVVEELASAGVERAVLVTAAGKSAIEDHFDRDDALIQALRLTGKEELLADLDHELLPIRLATVRQPGLHGLGHAVLAARAFVGGDPFVAALGDCAIHARDTTPLVERMAEVFRTERADAVIAFETVAPDDVSRYGVADPAGDGAVFPLRGLVEKPARDRAPSRLAVAGRYVLSPRIFDILERTAAGLGGEIQLTDAIAQMIRDGGRVFGVALVPGETRLDVGSPDSYLRAFVTAALADPAFSHEVVDELRKLLDGSRP